MVSSTFPADQPLEESKPKRNINFRARTSCQNVQLRSQRLYSRQLEGKTTRALVLEHSKIEGISEVTAWQDWKKVKQWNKEDWEKDRETLLPRLQAPRRRTARRRRLGWTLGQQRATRRRRLRLLVHRAAASAGDAGECGE